MAAAITRCTPPIPTAAIFLRHKTFLSTKHTKYAKVKPWERRSPDRHYVLKMDHKKNTLHPAGAGA